MKQTSELQGNEVYNSKAVPLTLAADHISFWKNFINDYVGIGEMPVNGFQVPLDDLKQIMQNATSGVRIYCALAQPDNLSTLHLYMVPVDPTGHDIIDVDKTSVIYDTVEHAPSFLSDENDTTSPAAELWQ